MTVKRTLKRRLDELEGDHDGPDEIVFTDHVVPTGWNSDDGDRDPEPVSRLRCWRDETGQWHSEQTDLRDRDGSADQ